MVGPDVKNGFSSKFIFFHFHLIRGCRFFPLNWTGLTGPIRVHSFAFPAKPFGAIFKNGSKSNAYIQNRFQKKTDIIIGLELEYIGFA